MQSVHAYSEIFVAAIAAAALLFIGFGQGLTFNVKGFAFTRGLKFSLGEFLFVAIAVLLLWRNAYWAGGADAFLAIGTMIGVLTTRHERPVRFLSRPGYQPGCQVNRLV